MNCYDMTDEQIKETGIDYDLCACLEYNPQSFIVEDIVKVLAVVEGERDSADWHWIILLKDNKYVYLTGGCDYTGWDCVSWAYAEYISKRNPLWKAVNDTEISKELQSQLAQGKIETWREKKDKEFGIRGSNEEKTQSD